MAFNDFRGGETVFNQAQFQMIRLHELMTTINECWVNFGGYVDEIPAHQVLFNVLSGYFIEVEPTFTAEESEIAEKKLQMLERLITSKPFWTNRISNSLTGSKTTKEIHYVHYYLFRKELRDFQMLILRTAAAHGIGNPTKKDPRKAIIT